MHNKSIRRWGVWGATLAVVMGCSSTPVKAVEGLHAAGFMTLGANVDDSRGRAPTRDVSQLGDESTDSRWVTDSRVGVQLEYGLSPTTTLVGQGVWRDQYKSSLASLIELAYIAFNPKPDVDLRLGRINYDTFMLADIRNVGYAYSWVRPPEAFYGWIPIFSVNGVDATYGARFDSALWRMKLQGGESQLWLPIAAGVGGGYEFSAHNLTSLSLNRQTASWNIKAAYSQFTIGTEVPCFAPLQQGLAQVAASGGAVGAEAADLLRNDRFKDTKITYSTLGVAYDDGTWNLQSEIGHTSSTAAVIPHGDMAYLSIARRIDEWTPFLLLSAYRPSNSIRAAENDWGSLNDPLRNPAVNLANATRIYQHTISVGTRWDFRPHAALKLQLDSTKTQRYGSGLLWVDGALQPEAGRMNLLSASLDFVF